MLQRLGRCNLMHYGHIPSLALKVGIAPFKFSLAEHLLNHIVEIAGRMMGTLFILDNLPILSTR